MRMDDCTEAPPVSAERLIDLHHGWQLAELPAETPQALAGEARGGLPAEVNLDWLPAAVPGSVHGALLAAGRIPDPFHGLNEQAVQWVGERRWLWRLHFDVALPLAGHEDLVFEGLDTYARAWLNGTLLFAADNMFVPHRVDVRALLKAGRNELLLQFEPPLARARAEEAQHGRRALWNGDSARLHARKAQYHFGWDWGPVLLTSGPWRPVRRHSHAVRIDEVQVLTDLDVARRRAKLRLRARLSGAGEGLRVEFELRDPQGRVLALPDQAADRPEAGLDLDDIALWWPRGLGAQPLYTLVTRVRGAGRQLLAEHAQRIGLRTLVLKQEPVQGEPGTSFHFEVNGEAFFAGGANWIPEDLLQERVTPARLRERVAQAADANMNMLRVWGGGVYEDDAFYDACDELGLLVWQDFMFACGLYPAHAPFQASVQAEAEAAVKRLRHHACLALWCGNNEDYSVAESLGHHGPGQPAEGFPARAIYEQLLPAVCAAHDPGRAYWPGSPYTPPDASGQQRSASDSTIADRHSWEVWHQQMLPYQRYGEVGARFVSEFGLQSHASLPVLEAALPPDERYPESRTLAWHNKAGSGVPDGHRRLAVYLADNLRAVTTLAGHVYATQFIQAEAMRVAYQDFRARWQQPGARACGGALVWQLNDCWPATSWALIDVAGTPKPAWHSVRRALAPLAVALRLAPGRASGVLMNAGAARPLTLALRLFALDGRCVFEHRWHTEAVANGSQPLAADLPAFDTPVMGELCALAADDGPVLARDCAWPEPFRFHALGRATLQIRRTAGRLSLQTTAPIKGLWLQADSTRFDDNFIDLVPGEAHPVSWVGETPSTLRWRALDHAEQTVPLAAATLAQGLAC